MCNGPVQQVRKQSCQTTSEAESFSTTSSVKPATLGSALDEDYDPVSTGLTKPFEFHGRQDEARNSASTWNGSSQDGLDASFTDSLIPLSGRNDIGLVPYEIPESQGLLPAGAARPDVMPLKDWISKVNANSKSEFWSERGNSPATQSPATQNPASTKRGSERPTNADMSTEPNFSKQEPRHSSHGTIMLYVRPRSHVNKLAKKSERQLLDGVQGAFTHTRRGKERLGYIPTFMQASFEDTKIRLELSAASANDIRYLQDQPQWADGFCIGTLSGDAYTVDALEFPASQPYYSKRRLIKDLLKSNEWLVELRHAWWRGTRIRLSITSREDANRALSDGIIWDRTVHSCALVSGACFRPCKRCLKLGHKGNGCTKPKTACSTCGEDHPKSKETGCQRRCVNCGGSHKSGKKGHCDVFVKIPG